MFSKMLQICTVALFPMVVLADSVPEPVVYRTENYRSPVPETLQGATVVDTETAYELWNGGRTVFIDVMPQAPKPKNLPEGTIWRQKPRESIERSIWLPNVGYGELAEETHAYFKTGLQKATNGNLEKPILIFCLRECWMSWNAAKRVLEYGYVNVYWYPEGTDGWHDFLNPTEKIKPE